MPGAYQGSPRALRESHRQHAPGPSFAVPSPMTAVQAATGRAAAGSERVALKLPPVETSVRRDHDRHLRQRSLPRGCDRRGLPPGGASAVSLSGTRGRRGGRPSFSLIDCWISSLPGRASTVKTYSLRRKMLSTGLVFSWYSRSRTASASSVSSSLVISSPPHASHFPASRGLLMIRL